MPLSHGPCSATRRPELLRLNRQLVDVCRAPRTEPKALHEVQNHLGALCRWLAAAPASPGAATALLYAAGDGLAHAEHAVRSVGLVRFWQPAAVAAFASLAGLYNRLLAQAAAVAQAPEQLGHMNTAQQQEQQRKEHGAGQEDGDVGRARCGSGEGAERAGQQPQHPLAFAVASLLLRPDWLDLLTEVLQLLHFGEGYGGRAGGSGGGQPAEAVGWALQLWSFLIRLVKFAAVQAQGVQRMEVCLQRLAALLSPAGGVVPRLLDLPLRPDTLAAQLHALRLLQELYDMPDSKVLYVPALADHYVALHHNSMVTFYEASAADPRTACAELCRLHATLLRSMARHAGQPVRGAFARLGTVGWLLREVSLESQLLPAALQEAAEAEGGGAAGDDSDSESDSSSLHSSSVGTPDGERTSGKLLPAAAEDSGSTSGQIDSGHDAGVKGSAGAAPSVGAGNSKSGGAFAFTYDLNEDVERLIALEDELGRDVQLEGFEYDDEGRQLMARSEARQRQVALEEQAAATAAVEGRHGDRAALSEPGGMGALGSARTESGLGFGSTGAASARSSGVPRLALLGLRTASISSMAGGGSGKRSTGTGHANGAARGLNPSGSGAVGRISCSTSAWGGTSVFEDDEDEELGAEVDEEEEDGLGSGSHAKAEVTERIARWTTTLADAAADGNGGVRSTASGSGAQPHALTAASQRSLRSVPEEEDAGSPRNSRVRELTNAPTSLIHASAGGELALMVPSTASSRLALGSSTAPPGSASGKGLPPLGSRPVVPPLRMNSAAIADGAAAAPASTSSRAPPSTSSRAMVALSASNRAAHAGGVWCSSTASTHPPPQSPGAQAPVPAHADAASTGRSLRSMHSVRIQAPDPPPSASNRMRSSSVPDGAAPLPMQPSMSRSPLIPALNLSSLRGRPDGPATAASRLASDTGRTLPLSALLRRPSPSGSLPHGSAMDPCATPPSTAGTRASAMPHPPHPAASSAPPQHDPSPTTSESGAAPAPAPISSDVPPPAPPEPVSSSALYQQLACQRLLYADAGLHTLLLKVLLDLLVTPAGGLDPAHVGGHQPGGDGAGPHAEYALLWHLNAPRNAAVVHELCRGAQRRAAQQRQLAAARLQARQAPQGADGAQGPAERAQPARPVVHDSAREFHRSTPSQQTHAHAASAAAVTAPAASAAPSVPAVVAAMAAAAASRPCGVSRALHLLSRPLFDAGRYSNLQFVARGASGDIFRARMEAAAPHGGPPCALPPLAPGARCAAGAQQQLPQPPQAQQVVIKTIQLPGSPYDSCVLGDVYGEVAIMERFKGHDCICQLLDYGMHDDAYWLVMRRYRCSLAEWRARQRPLEAPAQPAAACPSTPPAAPPSAAGPCASAAAAAAVYLSALAQVVEALQLLAAQNVVHFDLKCANVLIEPLPGVSDGVLWAPVGAAAGAGGAADGCVPFRCVLADFGEARAYRSAAEAFTARNRGTEVFKSPEMLLMNGGRGKQPQPHAARSPLGAASPLGLPPAPSSPPAAPAGPLAGPVHGGGANSLPGAPAAALATSPSGREHPYSTAALMQHSLSLGRSPSQLAPGRPPSAKASQPRSPAQGPLPLPPQPSHALQQHSLAGAGLASDVWSLGCLAYELLSGSVLFGGDYASVTHRVAFGTGPHLALSEAERGRLGGLQPLVALVEWILARDPARRPSLGAIRERIAHVRAELGTGR